LLMMRSINWTRLDLRANTSPPCNSGTHGSIRTCTVTASYKRAFGHTRLVLEFGGHTAFGVKVGDREGISAQSQLDLSQHKEAQKRRRR